jgi:hypothetical protein
MTTGASGDFKVIHTQQVPRILKRGWGNISQSHFERFFRNPGLFTPLTNPSRETNSYKSGYKSANGTEVARIK